MALYLLVDWVQKFLNEIGDSETEDLEESRNPSNRSEVGEDSEKFKKNAKLGHSGFKPFPDENMSRKLLNPPHRTRRESINNANEAGRMYTASEYYNFQEAFEEDVLYSTEDHFMSLLNAVISNIRDDIIQERAHA